MKYMPTVPPSFMSAGRSRDKNKTETFECSNDNADWTNGNEPIESLLLSSFSDRQDRQRDGISQ